MINRKGLLSLIGIVFCTLVIHSYMEKQKNPAEFPAILYGIPTYSNSREHTQMSSYKSDPYVAVFLSPDPTEKVIAFYQNNLKNARYKQLKYGRTNLTMIIHQFELKKGSAPNFIHKGVEIIEYNDFNSRVFNAKTKIKIYIPQDEIAAAKAQEQGETIPTDTLPDDSTETTTPPESTITPSLQ